MGFSLWVVFLITNSISLFNIGLFRFSVSSQVSFGSLWIARNCSFHLSYWHTVFRSICILFYVAYSSRFPTFKLFPFFAVTKNAAMAIILYLSLCSRVSVFIVHILRRGIVGSEVCVFKMLIVSTSLSSFCSSF